MNIKKICCYQLPAFTVHVSVVMNPLSVHIIRPADCQSINQSVSYSANKVMGTIGILRI